MNAPNSSAAPGLTMADIYYILFRHKGKILLLSLSGIAISVALLLFWPMPYQSEAKLFIKYVLDTKSPNQLAAADAKASRAPDDRGENIINTELEIITSFDLAEQVATNVGPDKVLAKAGGGTNALRAAVVINKSLLADVPKKTSVIHLTYEHPDPEVAQSVLRSVISTYLERHADLHRPGFNDFLTRQTDILAKDLRDTENELRAAKTNADAEFTTLEETRKAYGDQLFKVRQANLDAEAELASRQAMLNELAKLVNRSTPSNTTAAAAANSDSNQTAAVELPKPLSASVIAQYKRYSTEYDLAVKLQQQNSVVYTPESPMMKPYDKRVADTEKRKTDLEEQYPDLLAMRVATESKTSTVAPDPMAAKVMDIMTERANVAGLQSKVSKLAEQLKEVRSKIAVLDDADGRITELTRKKDLLDQQYRYYDQALQQSKVDESLGPNRVSNIGIVQAATPPARAMGKLLKVMAVIVFLSIGGALGLAFVLELYVDSSIKRPLEIENRLGLPLFLSIPRTHLNGKNRLNGAKEVPLLGPANGEPKAGENAETGGIGGLAPSHTARTEIAPWDTKHILRPFYETLRDRLITYFELKNLTHKPKLVAVTSCAAGAGVSTVAAGLAASMSETGDGNVLLVDMNRGHGSSHEFYKGDLGCALDDALEDEKREGAMVADNLYVVSESTNQDKLPRALPKRFKNLVPRLRASDYDYIIFDMPPVNQISVTPRLARFMDMVLMVVESERTDREVVKRSTEMLMQSKANVGVVLNKTKAYLPKRLRQEV